VSAQQSAASKSHELDAAVTADIPIRAFAFQGSGWCSCKVGKF